MTRRIATHNRKQRALELFLAGASTAEVAQALAVSQRTAQRLARDLEEDLARERVQLLGRVRDRLLATSTDAVTVLRTIATDPTIAPAVRVQACNALLAQLARMYEMTTMQERLAELERRLTVLEGGPDATDAA